MNTRALAALEIWNARNSAGRDRAFAVYMAFMVALVAVVPVARAVWMGATSPAGLALFADAAAPVVASLLVAMLWAGALLVGRVRGPALLAPFLTHTLAMSDLRGTDIFLRPMLRATALIATTTTTVAVTVGASLAQHGIVRILDVALFGVGGALVGAVTAALWLTGQAFPRAAGAAALSILILAFVAFATPALHVVLPWAWVGYPTQMRAPMMAALAALTVALLAAVPPLLNRLRHATLMAQSLRWDALVTHATGMDFASAVTMYQPHPRIGRRWRAVRPGRTLSATFFVRDAIGAARTPGRLAIGVGALAASGMLLTLALTPGAPAWLLGAVAGVIAFGGLGPLTDGLRHAASMAADFSPYGVSDRTLVAYHLLFPLVVTVAVLLAAVGVAAVLMAVPPGTVVLSALLLGLFVLGIRVNSAIKGPLPTVLLAPMPTPMGDSMAAVRLVWALDAIMLAALLGTAVASLFTMPLFFAGIAVAIVGTAPIRWQRRR